MMYVLYTAYSLVSLVFIALVLLEGRRHQLPWTPLRMAGLVACLVWPLALLAVLALVVVETFREQATMTADGMLKRSSNNGFSQNNGKLRRSSLR